MAAIQARRAVRTVHHAAATKAFFQERGVHADVVVHAALQLAHLRLQGMPAIAYQPVSTRHYRYGRTEALRPATHELLAFVRAHHAQAPRAERERAFHAAAESIL